MNCERTGVVNGQKFQFYKVRLKDDGDYSSGLTPLFQFYKVRLKGIPTDADLPDNLIFQFYKVRLKAFSSLTMILLIVFQFYKVRLKVLS